MSGRSPAQEPLEQRSPHRSRLHDSPVLRFLYGWVGQTLDPLQLLRALRALPWYVRSWRDYSGMPGAEPLRILDGWPALHDRRVTTSVDPHYYYLSGWAMRRIVLRGAARHVDVGSLALFANMLAAVVPVLFVDYRPLRALLSGLSSVGGSLLELPFGDRTIGSLSCLHVAEHVGLGRYGDPLDPSGTVRAAAELSRVLAPGGSLYFAVPVGRSRVCFNAHRVHSPEEVVALFPELTLVEHAGVHDDGNFVEVVSLEEFRGSEYACGMFHFVRDGEAAPSRNP